MKTQNKIKLNSYRRVGATACMLISLSIGNAQAQLEDGLLSYWDFENTFDDVAGDFSVDSAVADNGVGGTGVTFQPDGLLGVFGNFERTGLGTQNLVVVPDSEDLDASGESITVSAWCLVDLFNQNWQSIIVHGEGDDWRLARRLGEQGVSYAGGGGTEDAPGPNITPAISDGEWHHVVGITENGVSTRIWIDGVLIATNSGNIIIDDNGSDNLFIGGNPQADMDSPGADQFRPWNGGIDDLALWNRPLAPFEIQQLFEAGQNGISLSTILDADDADDDGLPDAFEIVNDLDPNDDGSIDINNGPFGDPDGDSLDNLGEFNNNTDPQDADTDDDFSDDPEELANETDPNLPDTDGDTLLDGHETNTGVFVSETDTGTDPLLVDTDGDGFNDDFEIEAGSEPNDITDVPVFVDTLPITDDFEDNSLNLLIWDTLAGTVSQNGSNTLFGGSVEEVEGCVQFEERGYLFTATEFDPEVVGGLEITGEMSFQNGTDVFSILTRATPESLPNFGEAVSGVQFILDLNRDQIVIQARNGDHTIVNTVVTGTIDFMVGVFYTFQVIDDGAGALSLVVAERDDPANTISATAELTADTSDVNHVIFYNREAAGRMSSLHEVTIAVAPVVIPPGDGIEIVDCSFDPTAGANGSFTITWTSQETVTYSINGSADLVDFGISVATGIDGEAGTTTLTLSLIHI